MKNLNVFRSFMAVTAALVASGLAGCGGGNDPYKADGAVKEGEKKKDEAVAAVNSANGIGRFADKEIAGFDAKLAVEGKALFESKCSACHKTTDEKVVGPGLKGVTTRRNANWILNMITNPEGMTKEDPVAKELLATHLTQMTNQNVDDDAALKLLNYLRENDGAK